MWNASSPLGAARSSAITTWADCAGLTDEHLASSFKVARAFIATYEELRQHVAHWATGKCCVNVLCDDEAQAREVMRMTKMRPSRCAVKC